MPKMSNTLLVLALFTLSFSGCHLFESTQVPTTEIEAASAWSQKDLAPTFPICEDIEVASERQDCFESVISNSISEYIIQNKSEYYKRLRLVTEEEEWEGWILYMLDMIERTSLHGLIRLKAIMALIQKMSDEIKNELPKVYTKDLIEIIFKLPYTKRQNLIDAGFGTPKTVGNYLIALEDKGFLKSVKVGKEKLYLNYRLMEILEKK